MKPHKWANEIKAWADGAEIEIARVYPSSLPESDITIMNKVWDPEPNPAWNPYFEYRIKPQPKESKYLYVYQDREQGTYQLSSTNSTTFYATVKDINKSPFTYIGKIKLEPEDV